MPQKIDEKLRKCFEEGKKGSERHKGLIKSNPDLSKSEAYLAKALHNFNAITDFHDLGYSDWSASASFYCLYVGLLAILAKRGYESRNQSCTFALVEDLIIKGEIKTLTTNDIKEMVLLAIPMRQVPEEKQDGSCSWCGKTKEYWHQFIVDEK